MLYVLDTLAKPPLVVDITEDVDRAETTAQRYADQTGRAVLIAKGPAPSQAPFKPTIPE